MSDAGTYIFKWHEKAFRVCASEILTYNGFSASHSFITEEKKNGKNIPKTKEVSPGIGTASFSIDLSRNQGNNVKAEHDWWVDECEKGTYSFMYMGGTQFGKYKWRVKQVDVSDLVTFADGDTWKSCKLSISFEEYYVKVKLTKEEKKANKLQKKLRKAIEKAENAKNDKARDKAMAKAETLAAQFKEAKEKAAEKRAEKAKVIKETDEKIMAILYPPKVSVDQQQGDTAAGIQARKDKENEKMRAA